MDIVGIYLREAMKEGCPICRILREYEESEIDTILYEHVNDPAVRTKFKESLGLCTYHAWKTLKKAYSNPLLGPLGVAIIYEHMLSTYIKTLESREKVKEGECFLCLLVEEKEKDTVEAIAERIEELLPVYESSEAILCKRHYEMIGSILREKNPQSAERLRKVQLEKLKKLREKMNSLIDKFDYRATERPTKEEVSSLPRVIEALKGLKNGATLRKKERKRRVRSVLLWR
ncbi:DUF6062 family protein [Thermococcus piezophilus]|uniref:Uncharacterized protein n=1 Tax=Thermococcus piezophilus TaxID=1712654 RepID=A0A172WJH8_9EURY|nr:DUF6062 family protein [Thermococcus piezophilus]ANF23476.1 hypothetical protein A7C91_10145 [Thermococcus piezophilus]